MEQGQSPDSPISAGTGEALIALPGAAALLIFAWLARQAALGRAPAWDASIRHSIHRRSSGPLTAAMKLATQLGSTYIVIPVGMIAVWRLLEAGRWRAAAVLAVAAAGAEIIGQFLKVVIRRKRPAPFFGLTEPFATSFPSTHAMVSICFYGGLAAILSANSPSLLVKAGLWIAAVIFSLAIGFSRVYLGVHYPSDVVGGYAAAVAWVFCLRAGYAKWIAIKKPGASKLP